MLVLARSRVCSLCLPLAVPFSCRSLPAPLNGLSLTQCFLAGGRRRSRCRSRRRSRSRRCRRSRRRHTACRRDRFTPSR